MCTIYVKYILLSNIYYYAQNLDLAVGQRIEKVYDHDHDRDRVVDHQSVVIEVRVRHRALLVQAIVTATWILDRVRILLRITVCIIRRHPGRIDKNCELQPCLCEYTYSIIIILVCSYVRCFL